MSVLLIFQAPQIRAITAIQLETLRCLGKIFIFCACLSLCSLQTLASETKLPELITGVKCERLLQLIPGQLSADNHGIIITLPRKKGICKKFQLAVYSSSGDALNIWNNSKPPQGAQASVLLGTGGQVKYWLNK